MKIVQIIPQLASGGAERFVVDLTNELSKNHQVLLIVSYDFDKKTAFYLPDLTDRAEVLSLHKKLGFDIIYIYRLYKAIKKSEPDVVHTHIEAFAYFAILKWLFPKVRFVHTVHNDAQFESGGRIKTFLKKLFFKRGWCKAATISAKSAASFSDFYGDNVKQTLIYNGRLLDVIPSKEKLIPRINGRYNIVSIGHISKMKNHMLLCSAVNELTKKGVPIELYMFGRFVDDGIVQEIKGLNNPHIHMLGERSNPMQHLHNADVFCMSSLVEGLPISLIEALSCGLIPICTDVGGISDLVTEGETGFLSYDFTIESYIKAIERFLALSKEEIATMKRNCLEKAKAYSIEECASHYEKLYKTL